MKTAEHERHIAERVSHNDCQECRADCERQFLRPRWPGYRYVSEYLGHIKPRLAAIRAGENSVNARRWKREFTRALHRRINLKAGAEHGRKYCDSYLERLGQFRRDADRVYLRRFASRGASALH